MDYFAVKNYEKFQHYKDRSPPWIKLYNDLLDNYEFACLQDASKLHLILIWLLASRHDNRLPWDETWIGSRIGATEPVSLDSLQDAGFIKKIGNDHPASIVLATCPGIAIPETERETEKENTRASVDALAGFSSFWLAYPKKKSKGQAERAWKKLNPDEQLQDRLLQALERAKKSADWQKDAGQFIPYPASWLNAKGWEDEHPTISQGNQFRGVL